MKTINLFEQEKSPISAWQLTAEELQTLVEFSEKYQERYFSITRTYFIPKNYVGRVQIGNIALQILPKNGDKNDLNLQVGLTQMLLYAQVLPSILPQKTTSRVELGKLWELYVSLLAQEVQRLAKKGLLKQYEQPNSNQPRWANHIDWSKHININACRPAYFYGQRWELNSNHFYNQIIAKAIDVANRQKWSDTVQKELKNAQAAISHVIIPAQVSEAAFNQITYNRQNAEYKLVLELSRFVILQLNPQMMSGSHFALSFWVEMPSLFEKYLKKQLQESCIKSNWRFEYQQKLSFWKNQPQRPDFQVKNTQKSYILDAKWKNPQSATANGDDLRQMFTYGVLSEASELLLIYPQAGGNYQTIEDFFQKTTPTTEGEKKMRLRLIFIELWDKKGELNLLNGHRLVAEMKKN